MLALQVEKGLLMRMRGLFYLQR